MYVDFMIFCDFKGNGSLKLMARYVNTGHRSTFIFSKADLKDTSSLTKNHLFDM